MNETPTREEIRLRNEGERDSLVRILGLLEDGATTEQLKSIIKSAIETIDSCAETYDKYFKDAETL